VKLTFNGIWLPALSSVALMLGCSSKAFFRADPPVNAQGLTMALVDQGCDLDQDPEVASSYVQDTMIAVQINNASPAPAMVDSSHARLAWNKSSTAPDQRAESVTLKPGGSARIQLHFTPKGADAACNNAMTLSWNDAVTVDGKPITVPPMKFQISERADP
jgi:hypothetical protein